MKKIIFMISFLLVLGGILQSSFGQVSVCDLCQTQVNTINQFDFGTSNGFKSIGFQANFSGSPYCQGLGVEWATSASYASITPDGEWCRIDFPQLKGLGGLGGFGGNIVQVCCTYSQWRDTNLNGIQDPWDICRKTLCINVNL